MQLHTLDKAYLVNEIQLGDKLNRAVESGRRADFALMMSLLSSNLCEKSPLQHPDTTHPTSLRETLGVAPEAELTASEISYSRSAAQSHSFHSGGMPDTRLLQHLAPTSLAQLPQHTCQLPEDLYHNLSGHDRRQLASSSTQAFNVAANELYNELIIAKRNSDMNRVA
jgi:hypothetical protein